MQVIKRRINIRDFAEKFGGNEPCIFPSSAQTSFGNIPYDIKVGENNDSGDTFLPNVPQVVEFFPLYYGEQSGDVKDIVLRFGTFTHYYAWIRHFVMESRYYRPENQNGVPVWTEFGQDFEFEAEEEGELGKKDLFIAAEAVLSGLPEDTSGFTCDFDFICVNEDAETFKKMFISNVFCNDAFFAYCNGVIEGNYEPIEPFVEISLAIDSDINDLGSEEYISGGTIVYDGDLSGETEYYTESQLKTLIRQKNTVDGQGNILDFIEEVDDSGETHNHLRYLTNIPQGYLYSSEAGAYTYGKIISISQVDESGNTLSEIDFDNLTVADVGKTGYIQFEYLIGCLMTEDEEYEYVEEGLPYEDRYEFTISLSEYNHLPYVNIDYASGYMPEWGDEEKRYAKVWLIAEGEEYISGGSYFRNDNLIGTTEVRLQSDNIDIERGASAAYEAFNVLGEVNSVEDIEKYRNDWYRIKGKND